MPEPVLHVLIPLHNEDEHIYMQMVDSIVAQGWKVIIVDDGSSVPVRKTLDSMTVIRHRRNLGQGAAVETGMEYARRMGVTYLIHMDGDGQHLVSEIEQIAMPVLLGFADIVFGSRFLLSSSVKAIPVRRRLLLLLARMGNRFFTGVKMSDAHNGFRALNQKAIQQIRLSTSGRAHASEIVWRAHRAGLKSVELPVHVQYIHGGDRDSISWFEVVRLGFSLIRYRLNGYTSDVQDVLKEREFALNHIQ